MDSQWNPFKECENFDNSFLCSAHKPRQNKAQNHTQSFKKRRHAMVPEIEIDPRLNLIDTTKSRRSRRRRIMTLCWAKVFPPSAAAAAALWEHPPLRCHWKRGTWWSVPERTTYQRPFRNRTTSASVGVRKWPTFKVVGEFALYQDFTAQWSHFVPHWSTMNGMHCGKCCV